MFRTFRLRLLFWFLIFVSSSFIIIALSLTYLNKREKIFAKSRAIELSYVSLLKSVQAQQDYFSYDTKNEDYFLTNESDELELYQYWLDSTLQTIATVDFTTEEEIFKTFNAQMASIRITDSLFIHLTERIKVRGFKSHGVAGIMRAEARWLEGANEISRVKLLSLRRREKDFIIRNEIEYIELFETEIDDLLTSIDYNPRISLTRKDIVLFHLNNYKEIFFQLVQLEQEMGVRDNTGLKQELDFRIVLLETGFGHLVDQTREWAEYEFERLTIYFGLTAILLVMISVGVSAFISHKLTKPLTELTKHITRFVDSSFTLENEHPVAKSNDEIGSLTRNFTILKDKVISQMKFFKQRVEDRTGELAHANTRLSKLSEANSRFVPKEFLQSLGKSGIEEISLGDQVEREMTVVFTDIRGFTPMSEAMSPQENFDFLNSYLSVIVPIIIKHGGFIDKFIGDSVMSLFPNSPDEAVRAVMEFEDPIEEFNKKLESKGRTRIHVGSGIHTGSMMLGTIGHGNRLETTVISDAVNTAARVEGLTKHYDTPVIVTEATVLGMKDSDNFHFRFLDNVQVKGKTKSLFVFQFLSPKEEMKIGYMDRYNQAIGYFQNNKLVEAEQIFRELYAMNKEDKAAKRFADKCADSLDGNEDDWSGMTYMTKK
jgi:adenylate cyclase